MPGYRALVDLISYGTQPDTSVTPATPGTPGVIARLVDAGIVVPDDFRILLGPQYLAQNMSAPRIVFVPVASEFPPRLVNGARTLSAYHSDNDTRERLQRAIRTEAVTFEVHCWGQADQADSITEDFGDNYDVTQALAHVVMQTLQDLAPGCWAAKGGKWTTAVAGTARDVNGGQEFVYSLTIQTPVLGALLFPVPKGTRAVSSVFLQPADPARPPEQATNGAI